MSIYQEFGVTPIINASGSVTRLGGATMPEVVRDALRDACADSVPIEQLQAAACKRLSPFFGTEAALVTSGAAAALTLGSAAILCGLDLHRMESLPHCDEFPCEMLIAREHRSGYDHAVRASGARLKEVGFQEITAGAGVRRAEAWEFEAAINDKTAGIVYVWQVDSAPPLGELVQVAQRNKLPILVDASGQLPPKENIRRITESGVDLAAFSGGKGLRGPQATGILCGRQKHIMSAALQMLDMDDHFELWDPPSEFIDKSKLRGMPRHGLGRGFKVGKEAIIALLTACDRFDRNDFEQEHDALRNRLLEIEKKLKDSPVECTISTGLSRAPTMEIQLNKTVDAFAVCRSLRDGRPPVYVSHGKLAQRVLVIDLRSVAPHDDAVLAKAIAEAV